MGSPRFRFTKAVFLKMSAFADHLRKIPHTLKKVHVNRRNITPVITVTITTFFYTYINVKCFLK
jgi:hypothetical protein